MPKKPTYKKEDIIKELVKLRLEEKYSITTLLQYIQDKYGYKISNAYNIIRDVNDYISSLYKDNFKDILERQIADLEVQREQAKKDKNNKLVLEITKEINKIYGLHSEKLDITSNGKEINTITIVRAKSEDE